MPASIHLRKLLFTAAGVFFLNPQHSFADNAALPIFDLQSATQNMLESSLPGSDLPPSNYPRGSATPGDLPAGAAVSTSRKPVSHSDAIWKRRWAISLAPLAGSQVLDAASSYGMRELNPFLAGADGGFGMKASVIKLSVASGLVGVEYLVVRKFPRSAKLFSILNWTSAGVTGGFATHNFKLK